MKFEGNDGLAARVFCADTTPHPLGFCHVEGRILRRRHQEATEECQCECEKHQESGAVEGNGESLTDSRFADVTQEDIAWG